MRSPVGAGLPAKIANDNAGRLTLRGVLRFFAGKPAPTWIAFILLLSVTGTAHAFDLKQLSDQLAKSSVIHGSFTQEKHLRALPQPLVSQGTFVLAKDHGLLWLLKTPLQQDYRISAQGIARRDASGWQLLPNKSAGAEQNRLFLAVLQGDSSGLQRDFELQLQGQAQQWKLTLIPRSLLLKQVFTQINIDGGDLVHIIELLETQGDSTVLRMQDSHANGQRTTRPEQKTMRRAMELALEDAGLTPDAIGYLNGHGTATDQGDIAETLATSSLFGSRMPISSQKSFLGHTLGACGALESWFSIEMMNRNQYVHTFNLESVDPQCGELDYLQGEFREMHHDYVMNNNFAFGGVNTSLIFRRWS